MSNKGNIRPGQWTAFWNSLGIVVPKRQTFLKRYNPRRSDINPLLKLGVEKTVIDTVYSHLSQYRDPLLFHKFCRFFRRDPYTVQIWSNTANLTEAFRRLYRIFLRHSLLSLKDRFQELQLLSEYNRKGLGRRFEIKYRRIGSLANISGQQFTRILNRDDIRAKYEFVHVFTYEKARIICIRKKGPRGSVYKFIRLIRSNGTVLVQISADSKSEYALIRRALTRYFHSYVDSPQITTNLTQIRNFMRTGNSEHFTLSAITYFHDDYRITVFPKFNLPINVTNYSPYKSYSVDDDPEKFVVGMRLLHKELPTRRPIPIEILTSANSDLIGAILFRMQDRRLNSLDRRNIIKDLSNDFSIEPGSFVPYDDLTEKEIYRRLLQVVGRRVSEMQLRSDLALTIFKTLVAEGIVEKEWVTQDNPLYCVNRDCRLAYGTQRGRQYCTSCGEQLLPGHTIVQPKINEYKAVQYLAKKLAALGLRTEVFSKKLLGRGLNIVSILINDLSVQVIPITTNLNDSRLTLLRLRMPNALVLTARDNLQEFSTKDIECQFLFEFLYLLEQGQREEVLELLNDVAAHGLDRIRRYVRDAAKHYVGNSYYQTKNDETKNLGAEMFEAHTHLLFSFMFRNSIWLGANQRGVAVPDGISAFPILDDKPLGCFLWDSKYSDGKVNLGKNEKNQHYISSSKKNDSIRGNGGLGGLMFVGNQSAPRSFVAKCKKLGGPRKPKITYLKSTQLLKIFRHFRRYENDLTGNTNCHRQFVRSMDDLFFNTSGRKKALVISDEYLSKILKENIDAYKKIRTPSVKA